MLKGALPVFCIITLRTALARPTVCMPKSNVVGTSETWGAGIGVNVAVFVGVIVGVLVGVRVGVGNETVTEMTLLQMLLPLALLAFTR